MAVARRRGGVGHEDVSDAGHLFVAGARARQQTARQAKPLQGDIVIDTNGGAITVPVRADIPIRPFPGGKPANAALAGAKSPRQVAVKAKANPVGAAVLFEQGAVKAWYGSNGWTYPVQGTQASGKAAIQQFFEALGLTKPPRLEIDTQRLNCQGRAGQRLTEEVTISSPEPRAVYAQAWSNQPWIKAGPAKSQGNKATIPLLIEVPPPVRGQTLHADVTFQGNGQRQFVVPVTLAVSSRPAVAAGAEDDEPAGGVPWCWMFAGAALLLVLAVGAGAFVYYRGRRTPRIRPRLQSPPTRTRTSPTRRRKTSRGGPASRARTWQPRSSALKRKRAGGSDGFRRHRGPGRRAAQLGLREAHGGPAQPVGQSTSQGAAGPIARGVLCLRSLRAMQDAAESGVDEPDPARRRRFQPDAKGDELERGGGGGEEAGGGGGVGGGGGEWGSGEGVRCWVVGGCWGGGCGIIELGGVGAQGNRATRSGGF